jgi:long-subunit acyl-CoA synthetase (AMP-forming)
VAASICNALEMFSKRPFLGKRDEKTGKYSWISYHEIETLSLKLAHVLRDILKIPKRSFVGICGPNDEMWVVSDFACCLSGMVCVGLHQNFSISNLVEDLRDANIRTIITIKNNVSKNSPRSQLGKNHLLGSSLRYKSQNSNQSRTNPSREGKLFQ